MANAPRLSKQGAPRRPGPVGPGPAGVDSAAGRIVDAVVGAVSAGRLPPGTKLGEEELARLFDVGRTVVRDALKRLGFLGLVDLLPNRGAFVAQATHEEAEQIYAARRLIEGEIVRDVARHCTAADVRRPRDHIDRQAAAKAAGDRGEYISLLGEFHLVIAALGGNRVLEGIVAQLVSRSGLLVTLYDSHDESCALDDHAEMIDMLARGDGDGDGDGCAGLMARHLRTNERRLRIGQPQAQPESLAEALLPNP
jgi:DNA-binding GntR family transcriptional regulator